MLLSCLDSHLADNRRTENYNSVMKDHFCRLFLFFFLAFFWGLGGLAKLYLTC